MKNTMLNNMFGGSLFFGFSSSFGDKAVYSANNNRFYSTSEKIQMSYFHYCKQLNINKNMSIKTNTNTNFLWWRSGCLSVIELVGCAIISNKFNYYFLRNNWLFINNQNFRCFHNLNYIGKLKVLNKKGGFSWTNAKLHCLNTATQIRSYSTIIERESSIYNIDLFCSSDDLLFSHHIYFYNQFYNDLVLTKQLGIFLMCINYIVYFILLIYLVVCIYKFLRLNLRFFLFELCFIISRDIKLYENINNLHTKINAYLSSRDVPYFKYKHLKATSFAGTLPNFVALGAIAAIAATLSNIDGQLYIIETSYVSPHDQLMALQLAKDSLDSILKDNAQCANQSVNVSERAGVNFIYVEYPSRYNNTLQLYESEEWRQAREISNRLKDDMIKLHKAGVVNENSYKRGSQILKLVKSDFPDTWKSYEYRWKTVYAERKYDILLELAARNGWK